MADKGRRNFIAWGFGGFAAIGGVAALVPMKKAWDPLPSALSSGFTTVELSSLEAGKLNKIKWRGKPVFVMKKTADMPVDEVRDLKVGADSFLVVIGLCTHLGCIPTFDSGKFNFKCPCHGGEFDISGKQTFGPPPTPLVIPPFKVTGTSIVLGEEGPEYQKMLTAEA
jgi:ubiquinol-cytochrome c reductase iron-sulfur subunit